MNLMRVNDTRLLFPLPLEPSFLTAVAVGGNNPASLHLFLREKCSG
jgi:hypothetical protein